MILVMLFMFQFGLPIGMLNLGREKDDLLNDPISNNWAVDALLGQFLIILAQPKMDNLAGSRERPCAAVDLDLGKTCENL